MKACQRIRASTVSLRGSPERRSRKSRLTRATRLALLSLVSMASAAQETTSRPCADTDAFGLLDFWVGTWEVFAADEKVGENRIEKILDGCAIMEHWEAVSGTRGKSLFFVDDAGTWQQVWVTQMATTPGGVKEKTRIEDAPAGSVRFQGKLTHPGVGSYLDRTTLTPMEDGSVRQLIEVSMDDGESWRVTFDAAYRRPRAN